jgi:hypothetical protein
MKDVTELRDGWARWIVAFFLLGFSNAFFTDGVDIIRGHSPSPVVSVIADFLLSLILFVYCWRLVFEEE